MAPNDTVIDIGAGCGDLALGKALVSEILKNNAERRLANSQKRAVEALDTSSINEAAIDLLHSATRRNDSVTLTETSRNLHEAVAAERIAGSFGNIERSVVDLAGTAQKSLNGMAASTEAMASAAQKSLDGMAASTEAMASTAQKSLDGIASCTQAMARSTEQVGMEMRRVAHNIHGVHATLLSGAEHQMFMQAATAAAVAELPRMNASLRIIAESQCSMEVSQRSMAKSQRSIAHSLAAQNSLTAQGGAGRYGFAQTVYWDIVRSVKETEHDGPEKHRFFIYHPDNDWYGSFQEMIQKEGPLPGTFCSKSNSLDSICLAMLRHREALSGTADGRDVVFHLLMPAYYPFTVSEPLHFPDELQPLRIRGMTNKGGPVFTLNLPAAPPGMLDGINNSHDPGWLNKAGLLEALPGAKAVCKFIWGPGPRILGSNHHLV